MPYAIIHIEFAIIIAALFCFVVKPLHDWNLRRFRAKESARFEAQLAARRSEHRN